MPSVPSLRREGDLRSEASDSEPESCSESSPCAVGGGPRPLLPAGAGTGGGVRVGLSGRLVRSSSLLAATAAGSVCIIGLDGRSVERSPSNGTFQGSHLVLSWSSSTG